jgi:hypothetical protein
LPNTFEWAQTAQSTGYNFHSLVVQDEGKPILYLPLFETQYYWTKNNLLTQILRKLFSRLSSSLIHPAVLGVGFVGLPWSQIGKDSSVDPETMSIAWDVAFETLYFMAKGFGTDMITFCNFAPGNLAEIPDRHLENYHHMVMASHKLSSRKSPKATHFATQYQRPPLKWLSSLSPYSPKPF